MVTDINFLLMIPIHCQEIRFWELIKWSPKRKYFDLLSFLWTHSLRKYIEISWENLSLDIGTEKVNTDTPLKQALFMVPSVSLLTGFNCISISWNIFNQVLVLQFIIQSNVPALQDHQTQLHLWFLLSQMTTHHHPQLHIYRLLEPGEKVLNNQ